MENIMNNQLPIISRKKESENNFSFTVGQLLRKNLTIFVIAEEHADQLVLQHVITNEKRFIARALLYAEYLSGSIGPCSPEDISRLQEGDVFNEDNYSEIAIPINRFSKAAKEAGLRHLRYIRSLRDLGYSNLRPTPILKMDLQRLKKKFQDSKPLSTSTIYRWSLKLDKHDGDLRVLFPNFSDRGGRKQSRQNPITQRAIDSVFAELRNRPTEKIRYFQIENSVKNFLIGAGKSNEISDFMPSRSTIERVTKSEFTQYEIYKRNRGEKAADKKFAQWYPRDRALRPLEVVEFDDKDTRVFLINEQTGLPSGRAYVTAGVDQYSALPLGFSISSKPRDAWSAINTYANAILPKDLTNADYREVKEDVEFFGAIGICIFDNALYFHAKSLETTIIEGSNSLIGWAKPYTPREKSVVEDFNGQMVRGIFSELPGFGGEKGSQDGLSHGMETATMSELQFKQCLLKWSYDIYCNNPRASGETPRQRWHSEMRHCKPRIPANLAKFRMCIGLERSVNFREEGINFNGLIYQNSRLMMLRRFVGSKGEVAFRYNPERLTSIFVFEPNTATYFEVETAMPDYTKGLTYFQHKLILKMAKQAKYLNPKQADLLRFRDELRILVKQARTSKKFRDRKFAERNGAVESDQTPPSNNPGNSESVTELEYLIEDIDDIEIEAGDEGWVISEDF
jgi:putative transposase